MKEFLKKVGKYIVAFFVGVGTVLGLVLLAILKRDPTAVIEKKEELSDEARNLQDEIRTGSSDAAAGRLSQSTRDRITEIKRAAREAALARARDRRRHG